MNEDIIKDIKKHAFYLKPGQKKRVKSAEARKRARKKRSHDRDRVTLELSPYDLTKGRITYRHK